MKRVRILDAYINDLELNDVVALIRGFVRSGKPHMVITANSLMVNCVSGDSKLKKVFEEADLVVADSVGIVWASRYLGYPVLNRIPGIDLIIELCSLSSEENYSIFLLGAHSNVIKKAAENLQYEFPSLNIAGTHHGYFIGSKAEEKEVIQEIKKVHPDILFVGIDVHHQEKWIKEHMEEFGVPVCMGVGGSFDVISDRLKRASPWVRKTGFEWVHRFLLQPWRIVRLIKLPVFVYKVFRQKHSPFYL